MPADIAELNRRCNIPGVAEVIAGNGGLAAVRVTAPQAHGTIYLHGGHVAAWKPGGAEEVLWLSAQSNWQPGKPIRGGVPICFPWFGNAGVPQHGFARLREWQLESVLAAADGIEVCVSLTSDAETKKAWPHDFMLRHRVAFGRELRMQLELTNTGAAPLAAEEAQHTYFSVGDIHQVFVRGLAGARYRDKADAMKEKLQEADFAITAFTDRPYFHSTAPVILDDALKRRRITVAKQNSASTVVWNPWDQNAKLMPDFGDDEWPGMLCIETANIGESAINVPPGATHVMATRLTVEPMPR